MAGPGRYMVPSLKIPDETSVEVAHLSTLAADVIEALPNSLTRSMSDLKELDAVLGASLEGITGKLDKLLNLIYDESVSPQDRLVLLKEVAEDVVAFKLGGEDKIRVATGTCETILQHSAQLDMIASLLSSLMPPWVVATMPASSTPSGYPELFPSFAAAANTATAHIARPRGDFFLPPGAHPSGSAAQSYASAVEAVNAYRAQGRLQPLKSQQYQQQHKSARPSNKRSAPTPAPTAGYSGSADRRAYGGESAQPSNKRRKQQQQQQNHQQAQVSDLDDLPNASSMAAASAPAASSSHMAQSSSQMAAPGPSPDKTKRRGGPKKQNDFSPDVSAASTPTIPSGNTASRQPRRRAAQTSYYADDDEEASAADEGSPEPAEPADEAALVQSGDPPNHHHQHALGVPRPPAVKKRSADSTFNNNTAALPLTSQPIHMLEDEEDDEAGAGAGEGGVAGREKLYCYCHSISYGEMIGCDNDDCEREWFHLDCLGLKQAPSGTWYCDECKAAMGNNGRRAARR